MLFGWIGLIIFLCISSFGFITCITSLNVVLIFLIGGLILLYAKQEEKQTVLHGGKGKLLQIGLAQLVNLIHPLESSPRIDKRLTGSQVIDDQLEDILTYVIRDYVYSWYEELTADEELPHEVRVAAQKTIISFASRMKEIDWIAYLTTKLVDDAASHLRLFRQAKTKIKQYKHTSISNENKHEPIGEGGYHRRVPSGSKFDVKTLPDLETLFFDLEFTMEENQLCRDHICLDSENEKVFLQEISQIILFLLTPEEDFHCSSVRFFTRELLVNSIFLPLVNLFSDPDYINQIIIWLCKDIQITSEVFTSTLRSTDNLEELYATRDILNKEFSILISKDSGGDDDAWVKQQLSSLTYLRHLIESCITRLQEGVSNDSTDLPSVDYSHILNTGVELFSLPLDVILKNNIALSYFIDYMTSISAQSYLFFFLNVEGWKASAEQQLSDLALQKLKASDDSIEKAMDATKLIDDQIPCEEQTLDRMREAAYSIFDQYLSEKASMRLRIEESLVTKLLLKIRTEVPSETWFDDVRSAVYNKLQIEDKFLNGFRNSVGYVKLLSELELLKEYGCKSDDEDTGSTEELSIASESVSLNSLSLDTAREEGGNVSATISVSASVSPSHTATSSDFKLGPFTLQAEILEAGIVNEKGKTFGIYAVSVTKVFNSGHQDMWHVYRRYSDFYELNQKIREKYPDLNNLKFPGKKTFHNMDRKVLEERMKMLNNYLQMILQNNVLVSHPNLLNLLLLFFESGDYDKGLSYGQLTKTLDTLLVNPLRAVSQSMGQTVRTLPDNLINTVDGVMGGLNKVFQISGVKNQVRKDSEDDAEAIKVGASLDIETDDNIPLRILLLLMTEVFELKSRNQWLRRRIVILLRQIVRTMFGDIVNRRIIDYVFAMTSPSQVADYLRTFKHSYWPHGLKAESKMPRDDASRARTRVAAKVALLSCLSDEFKHILGIETSRQGLLSVFSLFQHRVLNRRLIYVLFEGVLCTLFSHNHPLDSVFTKLHSRSQRVIKSSMQRPKR